MPSVIENDSPLAVLIKITLSGKVGTITSKDYKGNTIIAVYSPIEGINLGIIVKVNLNEVQKSFIKTALLITIMTL